MKYAALELLNERETIEQNIEDKLRADISIHGILRQTVMLWQMLSQ
jgi:hypothetical protein